MTTGRRPPPSGERPALIVGVGARPGTACADIVTAVSSVLAHHTLRGIATVDRRAGDPGMVAAAAHFRVPILAFTPEQLATVEPPNPSAAVADRLGTSSVAEAAALLAGARLMAPKRVVAGVVVAAATAS